MICPNTGRTCENTGCFPGHMVCRSIAYSSPNSGWQCPGCGRCYSPIVLTCSVCGPCFTTVANVEDPAK